ncbi:rCG21884 [Rattus norvegicus]|uniref:RCG21884 n=1 Tax=Rattus norvegicus TaxID=10116 RepID=A6J250_RAT|nr:rCG21884 [Rattus norvegicus]
MVPALLVLQQHPRVLQVPGEVVTLPPQLVSRLLGLFISTLQLPKLWKKERGSLVSPFPSLHPAGGNLQQSGNWTDTSPSHPTVKAKCPGSGMARAHQEHLMPLTGQS